MTMDYTVTTTRTDADKAPVTVTENFSKEVKSEVSVDNGVTTRTDSGVVTTQETVAWEVQITG